MQFTSTQDINAPLDYVFQQLTDFDAYESFALRRGAQVQRKDNIPSKGIGLTWNVVGEFRGKVRDVDIQVVEYRPDNILKFMITSKGIDAAADFEAMALTRKQSRIKSTLNVTPKTISARLVLQSAKLAKQSLNRRYNNRFATFSNYIENNYNKSQRG
ncbi:MAG: SRPBCC family protein [Pseudomonadota bacterium]